MILQPKNLSRLGIPFRADLGPLPEPDEVAHLSTKHYRAALRRRRAPPRSELAKNRVSDAKAARLLRCVQKRVSADSLREETPGLGRRFIGSGANGTAVALAPCHPGRIGLRAPKFVAENWVVVKGGDDGTEPLNLPREAEDGMAIADAARGRTPHVLRTLGLIPSERVGRSWSVMELLRPMLRASRRRGAISTFAGMLSDARRVGYAHMLEAVFQTIWTLAALQEALPGFVHQDLNEGNIMVVPGTGRPTTYILRDRKTGREDAFRLPASAGAVKLIDFEFASWSGVPRHARKLKPHAKLGMSAAPNPVRDLALFVFLLRTAMQRTDAPAWSVLFSRFAEDVIPARLQRGRLRTELDTPTPAGNRALRARGSGVLPPAKALLHPIFSPFRVARASARGDVFRVSA